MHRLILKEEDAKRYERRGRGSEVRFYATIDEIQRWLRIAESRFNELLLLVEVTQDKSRKFRTLRATSSLADWVDGRKFCQAWLWPGVALGDPLVYRPPDGERFFSLNGLILLQLDNVPDKLSPSRIARVNTVANADTGVLRRTEACRDIYSSLATIIDASCPYWVEIDTDRVASQRTRVHAAINSSLLLAQARVRSVPVAKGFAKRS